MEAALHAIRAVRTRSAVMVPRHFQLPPGTPVNIVLKADQRSGKLTSGHVSEILTKGDHPRGVKVRLGDGQVGRVQSLGAGQAVRVPLGGISVHDELAFARGQATPPVSAAAQGLWSTKTLGDDSIAGGMRGGRIQDDVRNDPVPVEERSLEDYIKKPSKNKQKKGRGKQNLVPAEDVSETQDGGTETIGNSEVLGTTMQEELQQEFPKLDSALIAAILADHGAGEGTREVLRGLS